MFDVSLEVTSGGDTYTRVREDYIIALNDSLIPSDGWGLPGDQVEIVVSGRNTVPVQYIRIPIEFPGDLALNFDSFSTAGCRTDYFEYKETLHYDVWFGRRLTMKLLTALAGSSPDLIPGEGPLLKLYWTISPSAVPGQTASVILDGYVSSEDTYLPEYMGRYLDYTVPVLQGLIAVSSSCCQNRGDADRSGTLDPLDAIYMIDWLWRGGPGPQCEDEADVDGSGDVNPMDASYIVSYFWGGGPPPVPCQ
ncbi:MAG: hypothetical protein JSU65_04080, partial [Candidatus Zixiibacteriota bacterium]